MPYEFYSDCVGWPRSKVNDLIECVDRARSITYQTFCKNVGIEAVKEFEQYHGYDRFLRLKDDWAVSFNKSKIFGKTCYFIKWSGIEYVWIES